MHRLPLLILLIVFSIPTTESLAQLGVHSNEQLHQLELQARESALSWARQNNFPSLLKLDNTGAIGIVRVDRQHPVFFTTHNRAAGARTNTNQLHAGLNFGLTLTGSGLDIGIWDEGAVLDTHQEMDVRVTVNDESGASNHATHVAGTLIASGIIEEATGMAPGAHINSFNWNFHTSEMQSEANDGLLVSNHSYGRIAGWHQLSISPGEQGWYWFGNPAVSEVEDHSFGFYDRDASFFDQVAFNNPNYLPVVSAGNDRDDKGPPSGMYRALDRQGRWNEYDANSRPLQADGGDGGFDTMTSMAVAKNVLTVGSIGFDADTRLPLLSPFSSAGPSDDGRIKPDIMGIGENLLSPIASSAADYARYSGTSMATPNVAGSILLLQQLSLRLRDKKLRAATLKGLVTHTATDLGPKGPDYHYGWGLLNTIDAANLVHASFRKPGLLQELEIENGSTLNKELVHASSGNVKITLSWTDPPSPYAKQLGPDQLNNRTPLLINDLDIKLTHAETGDEFFPYVLSPDAPSEPARSGNNNIDPLEQIFIEQAAEGRYLLEISHKHELQGKEPQPFSLLMSNIDEVRRSIVLDSAFAEARIGKIRLSWRTKSETTKGLFVIERASLAPSIVTNTLNLSYLPVEDQASKGSALFGKDYNFIDEVYIQGVYLYRVLFIDNETQDRSLVAEVTVNMPAPSDFSISSVFPNPATNQTRVTIDAPQEMDISHVVYDLLGKQVFQSPKSRFSAGRHFISIDTSSWTPGIYFIQIESDKHRLVRKVVVMG